MGYDCGSEGDVEEDVDRGCDGGVGDVDGGGVVGVKDLYE